LFLPPASETGHQGLREHERPQFGIEIQLAGAAAGDLNHGVNMLLERLV
jgi:hypothetical protein